MTLSNRFLSTLATALLAATFLAPAANASLHDQKRNEKIAESIVPLKVVRDLGEGRFIAVRDRQVFYITNGKATPLDTALPLEFQIDAIEQARN